MSLTAVLVLAVAGCGSGAAPAPVAGSAPSNGDAVTIHNFAFDPPTLTVKPGAEVTWTFDDSTDHTVVADDNSFASQPMGNGQTYTHTFPAAGEVAYHCSIHPFMKATVTVK
ncbi:cupredoxin family copper-binding protein [Actinoplanes sp. Pm04-4]|uniref:Cupredoxin family copper-binding protein n=1 Tax=Paractinoplanes pyxinae TaxID=2997416 RepID=A0ABT4AR36_9ACTN|nr:cupredoxin family copper-binding protein [Actinoplanes pyxinae]MCY1136702.1 cupredoxin family copper-binding protein [Actinoplanes pyxinae]